MDKIKFDHSKDTVSETIGVSNERDDEIFEAVRDVYLAGNPDACKDFEAAIEKINPMSAAEYLLIGFKFADINRQVEQMSKKRLSALRDS